MQDKLNLDLISILDIINTTQALDKVQKKAEEEVHLAINALKDFEDSIYKKALIDLAYYSLDRNN